MEALMALYEYQKMLFYYNRLPKDANGLPVKKDCAQHSHETKGCFSRKNACIRLWRQRCGFYRKALSRSSETEVKKKWSLNYIR